MQETWIQSLGQEDLEKEMATHSSILAWKIPWTEEPGWLQSVGLDTSWTQLSDFTFTSLCPNRFPAAQNASLHPEFTPATAQGSVSAKTIANALVVQSLAMLLASANL